MAALGNLNSKDRKMFNNKSGKNAKAKSAECTWRVGTGRALSLQHIGYPLVSDYKKNYLWQYGRAKRLDDR
jgi:hypothetical protein